MKEVKARLNIRIPQDLLVRVKQVAEARRLTVTELVEYGLRRSVEAFDKGVDETGVEQA